MRRALIGSLLAAGCGGGGTDPRTLMIDGQLDVTISIASAFAPVHVYATGTDGELGEITETTGDATVSIGVQSGGAVTIVSTDPRQIATYLAVEPGDHLWVAPTPAGGADEALGAISVEWPDLGADRYQVITACSLNDVTTSLSITVRFDRRCLPADVADLLVMAIASNAAIGYAFLDAVPLNDTVVVPAWETPSSFTYRLTNAQEVDGIVPRIEALVDGRAASQVTDDVRFDTPGQETATVSGPLMHTGELWATSQFSRFSEDYAQHYRGEWLAPDATDWAVDATDTLIGIEAPQRDGWRGVSWTEESSGDEPDGVTVWMTAYFENEGFIWRVHAPYLGSEVEIPALPEELEVPLPTAGVTTAVFLEDFEDDTSYDDLRARPSWRHFHGASTTVHEPYRGTAALGAE